MLAGRVVTQRRKKLETTINQYAVVMAMALLYQWGVVS